MVQSERGTASRVRDCRERRLTPLQYTISVWKNEFDMENDLTISPEGAPYTSEKKQELGCLD